VGAIPEGFGACSEDLFEVVEGVPDPLQPRQAVEEVVEQAIGDVEDAGVVDCPRDGRVRVRDR